MTRRVAAVAWKLRRIRGDSGYFGHFHDLVSEAHDEGAEVVVFPELHVMELLSLEPSLKPHQAAIYLAQYADAIEGWLQRISDSSGLTIIGGSHFRETPDGILNVGAIATPNEPLAFAPKNRLTRFEKEVWVLATGSSLYAPGNGLGVTICYDSEFPEAGRALAEAGTTIHCVPAWTETRRGFQRVRWSCLARAVENQNFVVHASLVGGFGVEPVPESYGSSAIIAPSVEPFPTEAILRETELQEEGVIVSDLNLDRLTQAREQGEVSNWEDRHPKLWEVRPYAPNPSLEPEG